MNVYNRKAMNAYDEGRDDYIANHNKYKYNLLYEHKKLLLFEPVQETFDSGETSFDSYFDNSTYIITCDKSLVFEKEQKFEIFYDESCEKIRRTLQCFAVREFSNAHNDWSLRKIMLKPFN